MCAVDDSTRWARAVHGLRRSSASKCQCEVLGLLYPPYRDNAGGLECAVM